MRRSSYFSFKQRRRRVFARFTQPPWITRAIFVLRAKQQTRKIVPLFTARSARAIRLLALARTIVYASFSHLSVFPFSDVLCHPEERSRSLPASSSRFSFFSSGTADRRVLREAARDSFV